MEKYCIRFDEFRKELKELKRGRELDYNSESFILKGIVKSYELLFDLAWKTMKDTIRDYFGVIDYSMGSPAENIRQAFKMGLIEDDGKWIKMLKIRNLLTHDYDGKIALNEVENIVNDFCSVFEGFESKMLKFFDENKPL